MTASRRPLPLASMVTSCILAGRSGRCPRPAPAAGQVNEVQGVGPSARSSCRTVPRRRGQPWNRTAGPEMSAVAHERTIPVSFDFAACSATVLCYTPARRMDTIRRPSGFRQSPSAPSPRGPVIDSRAGNHATRSLSLRRDVPWTVPRSSPRGWLSQRAASPALTARCDCSFRRMIPFRELVAWHPEQGVEGACHTPRDAFRRTLTRLALPRRPLRSNRWSTRTATVLGVELAAESRRRKTQNGQSDQHGGWAGSDRRRW